MLEAHLKELVRQELARREESRDTVVGFLLAVLNVRLGSKQWRSHWPATVRAHSVVETAASTLLADPAVGQQRVRRADKLVVMQRHHHGHTLLVKHTDD